MPKFCLFACRSRHDARSSAASTTTANSSSPTHHDDNDDCQPPARVLTPTGKHFAVAQKERRRASPPPCIIVPSAGGGRNQSLFPSTTDVSALSDKPADSPVDSLHRHHRHSYYRHQSHDTTGSGTTITGSRPQTVYAAADSPVSNLAPTIRIVSDGATSPTPVDACHYENLAADDDDDDDDHYDGRRSATLRGSPSPSNASFYDSRPSTAFFDAESHLRFGGGPSCASLGRFDTRGHSQGLVPVAPAE
ncbi:uncharacterized protein BKCO1_1000501 [Diplodia corticola]|uniref:Uncharacterized protein n=1 Tax=Diplodia corticola TaxID=236234 RepID=A0A1J9RJ70_9PEZI|nr:uncharacterized protein BKCO1_1000501 [Diplodia corticola]OJD40704.1 hypothetical protein BKCO1_1000501 [Diplodia corticola]